MDAESPQPVKHARYVVVEWRFGGRSSAVGLQATYQRAMSGAVCAKTSAVVCVKLVVVVGIIKCVEGLGLLFEIEEPRDAIVGGRATLCNVVRNYGPVDCLYTATSK